MEHFNDFNTKKRFTKNTSKVRNHEQRIPSLAEINRTHRKMYQKQRKMCKNFKVNAHITKMSYLNQ